VNSGIPGKIRAIVLSSIVRSHDVIRTLGDHMDDITVLLPPGDRARLHLAAYPVSLQDKSAAVLVGILPEGDRTILLDENLAAGRGSSGPRTVQFDGFHCRDWSNPTE
jgi:hypothetical protein